MELKTVIIDDNQVTQEMHYIVVNEDSPIVRMFAPVVESEGNEKPQVGDAAEARKIRQLERIEKSVKTAKTQSPYNIHLTANEDRLISSLDRSLPHVKRGSSITLKISNCVCVLVMRTRKRKLSTTMLDWVEQTDPPSLDDLPTEVLRIVDPLWKNTLDIGSFFSKNGRISVTPGVEPLFWRKFSLRGLSEVYFGRTQITTIVNLGELEHLLKTGEPAFSIADGEVTLTKDGRSVCVESLAFWHNLMLTHLYDVEYVYDMIKVTLTGVLESMALQEVATAKVKIVLK